MSTEVIYHSLSQEIIGSLLEHLLFIGIFSVAFVIVRRSILDPSWIRSTDLIRHLVILFSIVLFITYIHMTYEIENFKGLTHLSTRDLIEQNQLVVRTLSHEGLRTAKTQLLILLPVDITGVAVISGLFAVLIVFNLDSSNWSGRNISTIREVVFLFSITAVWHMAMIVWWLIYGLFEAGLRGVRSRVSDILFHLAYLLLDVILVVITARIMRTRRGLDKSALLAWVAALSYCSP